MVAGVPGVSAGLAPEPGGGRSEGAGLGIGGTMEPGLAPLREALGVESGLGLGLRRLPLPAGNVLIAPGGTRLPRLAAAATVAAAALLALLPALAGVAAPELGVIIGLGVEVKDGERSDSAKMLSPTAEACTLAAAHGWARGVVLALGLALAWAFP